MIKIERKKLFLILLMILIIFLLFKIIKIGVVVSSYP